MLFTTPHLTNPIHVNQSNHLSQLSTKFKKCILSGRPNLQFLLFIFGEIFTKLLSSNILDFKARFLPHEHRIFLPGIYRTTQFLRPIRGQARYCLSSRSLSWPRQCSASPGHPSPPCRRQGWWCWRQPDDKTARWYASGSDFPLLLKSLRTGLTFRKIQKC